MSISFKNALTETPEVIFAQISQHPMTPSNQYIKLIIIETERPVSSPQLELLNSSKHS